MFLPRPAFSAWPSPSEPVWGERGSYPPLPRLTVVYLWCVPVRSVRYPQGHLRILHVADSVESVFFVLFCIDTHKQRQPRVDLQSIRGCCGQYNIIVDQRFTAKGRKQLMPGSKAGSIRGNRRHRCVASPPRPMKYTRNTPMVKKCYGHDRVTPLRQ